jgi:hypothetical protein
MCIIPEIMLFACLILARVFDSRELGVIIYVEENI